MRSAIGGYAEKASYNADQLVEAIREDQTDFLPRGLAEEVRRTEAIEAAKKREAEKRKREVAEMPPPDTRVGRFWVLRKVMLPVVPLGAK